MFKPTVVNNLLPLSMKQLHHHDIVLCSPPADTQARSNLDSLDQMPLSLLETETQQQQDANSFHISHIASVISKAIESYVHTALFFMINLVMSSPR